MCAKAWGAEGGRVAAYHCVSNKQGCYHALTCLQKRDGSQICDVLQPGMGQARYGACAAEAVTAEGHLLYIQTTLNMTTNHNTWGLSSSAVMQQKKKNSFIFFHRIRLWTSSLLTNTTYVLFCHSLIIAKPKPLWCQDQVKIPEFHQVLSTSGYIVGKCQSVLTTGL